MPEELAREEILRALVPLQKPSPSFPGRRGQSVDHEKSGPRVDVWRLPASSANMIGRTAETELLTRSWLSGQVNIIAVGGWGGAGKTTVVANWLAEMATYKYHGSDFVFAWSFDGQSDGEQWATSDQFFDTIIRFLGVESGGFSTTWERCREATSRLQRSRALLILDGLERLQHPPGPLEGTFRERVMQMFLRELAALNAGMLVVTSRLPIIDIDSYVGKTCRLMPIPELSRSESIEVLRSRGVRGETHELSSLAEEVRDHPLSLQLLSGYLQTVFDGDVRLWNESGLSRVVANDGGNTSAIMDQYVAWFADRPELQVLQIMGLFNREVTDEEIACLRALPVFDGLNDRIARMSRAEFAYSLGALRRAGLIRLHANGAGADVHPLVREHFQRHFRATAFAAYQEGHRRLRDLLSAKSVELPRTLDECAPIISAIWHGTRAGANASVFQDLYLPKLAQDNHFLRDGVGAAASNYSALTYIIEDTGGEALSSRHMAQVLGDQSLDLRMMGNTAEAVFPLMSAITISRSQDDPSTLANMLRHLSQLELAIGKVDEACLHAGEAVRSTELPGSRALEAISSKVSYSHALLHAGRYGECVRMLRDSGLFVRADNDSDRLAGHLGRLTLYIAMYRAGDALLTVCDLGGGWAESVATEDELMSMVKILDDESRTAVERAERDRRYPGVLAASLIHLLRARVALSVGGAEDEPLALLNSAVEHIRLVGQRPWIIESNIAKCRAMRQSGLYDVAQEALELAETVAVSDRMVLQNLMCRLERVQLEGARSGLGCDSQRLLEIEAEAARLGLTLIAQSAKNLAGVGYVE